MNCLTESECLNWLNQMGMPTSQFSKPVEFFAGLPFSGFTAKRFSIPEGSGRKVALARAIFWQSKLESAALVWLRNWMVFPSCAHIPLALRLREAMGCRESLEERPGILVEPNRLDDATSLLIISLEFLWDCLIVDATLRLICFVSHDEHLLLMSKDDAFVAQISNVLETNGLAVAHHDACEYGDSEVAKQGSHF